MRGGMSELIRSGNITAGVDIRIQSLEIGIGFDYVLLHGNTQRIEPVAIYSRFAPDGHQDDIEIQPYLVAWCSQISTLPLALCCSTGDSLVIGAHLRASVQRQIC